MNSRDADIERWSKLTISELKDNIRSLELTSPKPFATKMDLIDILIEHEKTGRNYSKFELYIKYLYLDVPVLWCSNNAIVFVLGLR